MILLFSLFSVLGNGQEELLVPKGKGYIFNGYYYYDYNPETKLSDWVGYTLRAEHAIGNAPNQVSFFKDTLNDNTPEVDEMYKSGYAMGHMVPRGDARDSYEHQIAVQNLANIIPMQYAVDQGVWRVLENMVRGWAMIFDSIHVVCGPIYENPDADRIGESKIRVPDKLFKVVLVYNGLDMAAVGFIVPNVERPENVYEKYMVPVDSVEYYTGMNFFSGLPDYLQFHLEAKIDLGVFQNLSNSYMFKFQFVETKQCVATKEDDERCVIQTNCVSQNCWKHGCDLKAKLED
jgi:endonuclease G